MELVRYKKYYLDIDKVKPVIGIEPVKGYIPI